MTVESPGVPNTFSGGPGTRLSGDGGEGGEGVPPLPVPLSTVVTVPADVTTWSKAERVPVCVGSNTTPMVHDPEAATLPPLLHEPPLLRKSPDADPVMVIPVIVIAEPPVLARVSICAPEAPASMSREPKVTLAGVSPGLAAFVPVPVRSELTVPTDVVTCSDAAREPT